MFSRPRFQGSVKGGVRLKQLFQRFRTNLSGTTAVEYALIAAMIAVTMVTVMGPVGEALTTVFSNVANALPQP